MYDNPAVVLGMYETGLGVGRSLARNGIRVIGIDYKNDMGFYSRFIDARTCPHPLNESNSFLEFMISLAKMFTHKPVLFMTSDDFVVAVSRMRENLSHYYLFNIPPAYLVEGIINKHAQYERAKRTGVSIPQTFYPRSLRELRTITDMVLYPSFVKGCVSHTWKRHFGARKGFVVDNRKELYDTFTMLFDKKIPALVQEIVVGPDTNHFKFCCYISQRGEFLLSFTLQKILQQPIRFGVGAVVESVHYPRLVEIGKQFFTKLRYCGVGSAEFKLDARDNTLKLIELNPRYWQQNELANICGMNFPLTDYLEVTGQNPRPQNGYQNGVKWMNIYMNFQSFVEYYRKKQLTLSQWLRIFRHVRVLSDFAWDDIGPFFYESHHGLLALKMPFYILRRILLNVRENK
jgi:D-aspartate ligase